MSNSKILSNKFQKICKGKLTDAELVVLERYISRCNLGLQYRLILRYYELLIGSTYDKKIVSETIANVLLSQVAEIVSLKKIANTAKRQLTQILAADLKRTPIARVFPESAKRQQIPIMLTAIHESPALLAVDLVELLSGKNNEQLIMIVKKILECIESVTFLRRCMHVIMCKDAKNDDDCLLYLTTIVKQYKVISLDKSESLYDQITLYGVNIAIDQQLWKKKQLINSSLSELNELLEDYAKSKTRLEAQTRLKRSLKLFLR